MQYLHAQHSKHFSAAKIGKGIEIPMLYCGSVEVTFYHIYVPLLIETKDLLCDCLNQQ